MNSEVYKYNTEKLENIPDCADDMVRIEDIYIPTEYRRTKINMDKIEKASRYFVQHFMLDKPISVVPETNENGRHNVLVLVDEYSRYIAALKYLGLKYVPVKYIDINEYCETKNM